MTIYLILVFMVFASFSARWNWWRKKKNGIPVLMYHKIGSPPKKSNQKKLWVSRKKFIKQMDYLLRHKYTPVLFSDLEKYYKKSIKLPQKPVLITFDDGYKNNYDLAFAVLKEKNIKANIFLTCESIGKHNHWHDPEEEPWQPMLDWEQILEMSESGLVEFGAHTLNHINLTKVDIETARWEIEECKYRLEQKLSKPVCAFAYPYGAGAYESKIRKLVLDVGFYLDFAIKQGLACFKWEREKYPLKRLLVRGDDNIFDFYLNLTRGRARF